MWPVLVVMPHIGANATVELEAAEDQEPVEALQWRLPRIGAGAPEGFQNVGSVRTEGC